MQEKKEKTIKRGALQRTNNRVAYLFIMPFILLHIVVTVIPVGYSFVLSFFSYKGYGTATFIGLDNYINLFNYKNMWIALYNTFFYFVMHTIPCLILGFLLGMAVRSNVVKRVQGLYKPLIFLPQMCAVVASCLVFSILFGTKTGVINEIFGTQIPFLTDNNLLKWPVTAMIIWRSLGWFFIILLTGMTSVSDELVEAATIDGANGIQRIFYIIIPVMKPIFSFLIITEAINSLKIYTEPNLVIHRFQLAPSAAAPFTNIVINALNGGNFGNASAAGWILCIITFILTIFMLRGFKGRED